MDGDDSTTTAVATALPPTCADEVIAARTGRDTFKLLGIGPRTRRGRSSPAMIIVELDLVDIDGFGMLRRLRAVRAFREVPIVAVSTCNDGEVIEAALEAGATDFVAKPFDRPELRGRLRACWSAARDRSRRRRREQDLVDIIRGLEAANEELRRWTCVDGLTGIANRHYFDRLARTEWQRAVRDGRPISAVMIDVDHFHGFNETYGHPAGDRCLIATAGALAACLRRASDVFARYGGEEFVAVLPDTDLHGASVLGERMRAAVARLGVPNTASEHGIVTVSIGVASVLPRSLSSLDELVGAADAALLDAKTRGRNRVGGTCDDEVIAERKPAPYPWPAPVLVDPALAGELPNVLRQHDEELASISPPRALEPPRVRGVARSMRSTAGSLGLAALEQLALQLDIAARCGDHDAVERAIQESRWYLRRVHVVYRRPDVGETPS